MTVSELSRDAAPVNLPDDIPPGRTVRARRRRTVLAVCAFVIVALAGGYVAGRLAGGPRPGGDGAPPHASPAVYTCSMHPQVRLDRPGKCPICEMPLVPEVSASDGDAAGSPSLQLSDRALAMAAVETTPVARRELSRELRAVGKVQYDESSLATVTARVDGYVERLFVNFTGVQIKAGEHLAEVWSPDLAVAQDELLLTVRDGTGPLTDMAKYRLARFGLTEAQINRLVEEKKAIDRVTLLSPITGTVIEKAIVQNSAFKAGDVLYRVANLDTVWVYLDLYEYDLPWVRFGQRVELTAEALPGRVVSGVVTFVQPVLTDETRTVRVPVRIENNDHTLKPGMYVSAVIKARLAEDGSAAPTGVEGKFTCVMHPQVLRDEPGKCPICDMPLERVPGPAPAEAHSGREGDQTANQPLAVPSSAVLDAGTRRIVYVKKSRGRFEPREVVLGPRSGAWFPVLKGVEEGERVVTRGGFLIDSQFQITGQPSLFYPGGVAAGAGGHRHNGEGPTRDSAPPPPPSSSGHLH